MYVGNFIAPARRKTNRCSLKRFKRKTSSTSSSHKNFHKKNIFDINPTSICSTHVYNNNQYNEMCILTIAPLGNFSTLRALKISSNYGPCEEICMHEPMLTHAEFIFIILRMTFSHKHTRVEAEKNGRKISAKRWK